MKNPPHVLVVEDDPEVRSALEGLLEVAGYQCDLATNGIEAINRLDRVGRPCAVLVDLLMPGIVGQELLEYLRSDVRLASIPVAIITASPQLAPDGYPVFRKPLDVRSILEFLRDGSTSSAA